MEKKSIYNPVEKLLQKPALDPSFKSTIVDIKEITASFIKRYSILVQKVMAKVYIPYKSTTTLQKTRKRFEFQHSTQLIQKVGTSKDTSVKVSAEQPKGKEWRPYPKIYLSILYAKSL